jgi:gliding motility-associated-like protein
LKRLILLFILSAFATAAFANHIKGGFFTYTYLGQGSDATKARYDIVLTVYMECNPPPSSGQLNNPINFSLFDGGTGAFIKNLSVPITNQYVIGKNFDDECISGDQKQCYYTIVEYGLNNVELPILPNGYVISYQRCCRIKDIVNIAGNSQDVGNTYAIAIPGSNVGVAGPANSSARFQINDTVVICGGSPFKYSFRATDPNGDSLRYYFCDAWSGGTTTNSQPSTADQPSGTNPITYPVIPYAAGFSGSFPLGNQVTIDPITGLISGIAPPNNTGLPQEYVITVCVDEIKNGVKIASTRKELHIKVGSCNLVGASLKPEYINCKTPSVTFSNLTPAGITSHFWDFGVSNVTTDTSSLAAPTFTYPDTGVYVVHYRVQNGAGCVDSTTATVRVFPGFSPGFTINGVCATKPTQFFDTTKATYGVVNFWSWNFGDSATLADTSSIKTPVYSYPRSGQKPVVLIVGSSKGCLDTLQKTINIIDKPPLDFRFRDTLICNGDTLQLHGLGSGSFSWTPNSRMFNSNTADPTVFPNVTTTYTARLDDNGCINNDTVRVRVVNFVTLIGRPDTTICLTDSVQLGVSYTNALKFEWTPVNDFTNPNILNAIAHPLSVTNQYHLIARIGHCLEEDDVNVFTVPYPLVNAGPDTIICYNSDAFLHGSVTATNFVWSPARTLNNPNILNPVAHPLDSTVYVLSAVSPLSGCPKTVRDTVVVNVLPQIHAFAGNDTAVIINQPLQFNATGGTVYSWTPATGLSNPNIPNPIGLYNADYEKIRYKVMVSNVSGCSDSAFITVKIFRLPAQVLVPTAFTPNSDGTNDVFRPIAVGITRIKYFRVYNRWGQLVFSTTVNGAGWDGKINGKEQGTDVFVWLVSAVDYTGKDFFAKGTVTLIR